MYDIFLFCFYGEKIELSKLEKMFFVSLQKVFSFLICLSSKNFILIMEKEIDFTK